MYTITLIGCGRMGGAMLRGWLKSDIEAAYIVVEPSGKPAFLDDYSNVTYAASPEDVAQSAAKSDICILAVKPQVMKGICEVLAPLINKDCLILSIAAGQTIANFESYFGEYQPIIRVMPNTPAAIGKGMSVAVANPYATQLQKSMTTQLLECSGKVEWIEDETLMNAVTAVSGSGPAYIFYLIEALAKAGQNAGLDEKMAMTLARQTVIGSAALAEQDADVPAATLRENVTSPNGTTQAALDVLMDGRLQKLFDEALAAAKKRGEELA